MIPTWLISTIVIVFGGIFAVWVGVSLPDQGMFGAEILALAVACVCCAAVNNFPLLLALAVWTPMQIPINFLSNVGAFFIAEMWIALILFFRLCLVGSLSYVRSFNVFLLVVFAWVPVRFLLNPISKLGATAGGSGVSGLKPYFGFIATTISLIILGAILNSRAKVISFLRWNYRFVMIVGLFLTACAFIPGTAGLLYAMGSFSAGSMGDGIQRIVQLPGYGLFLTEVALCPDLFQLKRGQSVFCFLLGFFMMIIGGNRSAMAAFFIAIPVILFMRRKSHALFLSLMLGIAAIGLLRFTVAGMGMQNIPPLLRSFGMIDAKIDAATGGQASANWRYSVWTSALEKIEESPLTGNGYGNLPQHIDPTDAQRSTDFEVVLAGGEAHNGFINAGYALGIPFTAALTLAIVYYFIRESALALTTDRHDKELRDTHAFLACQFATYPMLIYTAFEICCMVWTYVALAIILDQIKAKSGTGGDQALEPVLKGYGYENYSSVART